MMNRCSRPCRFLLAQCYRVDLQLSDDSMPPVATRFQIEVLRLMEKGVRSHHRPQRRSVSC
eukprot:4102830-Amphidinium_carterae.1